MTRQELRRWLREHPKITQRELARRLDVHFTTVNRWVSGKTPAHSTKPLAIPKWLPLALAQLHAEGRKK